MRVQRLYSVAALSALILAGCTPNWATNGAADVVLLMTSINNGLPLQSDVRISSGSVCADFVPLRLENHFINPGITVTGFRHDFTVFRYTVSYSRADGLNQQGVDVPFSISGDVSREVTEENTANLNLEVVRPQAKLEPPLTNLTGLGGSAIVTVFANITLYARTTTGSLLNPVSGTLQIDFADFGDTQTTCPAEPTS